MLDHIADKIKQVAADYLEVHLEQSESSMVRTSSDSIEQASNLESIRGNVRAYVNGGWGFASFQSWDFEAAIEQAILNARLSAHPTTKPWISQPPIVDSVRSPFEIDPRDIPLAEKVALAKRYSALLIHPQIANRRVIYKDVRNTRYFVNSEGSQIEQVRTFTGASIVAMAKDGTNVQNGVHSVGRHGGFELVSHLDTPAEEARERAVQLLQAPKVEAGAYRVLLDPDMAGLFAHEAFGHLSEADFQYQNPDLKTMMTFGKEFGVPDLCIADDGRIPHLAGYTPYDDEGTPAQRTNLIQDGKLCGRLHSRETALHMQEQPTGNARALTAAYQAIPRMTNTFIDNGSQSYDELLASIDDGIYALGMMGGMTNLEMFTFSAAYGFRVRNGQIQELLRDIVLTGNVFETLYNIKGIANDLAHYGGLGGCGKANQSGLPVSTGSPHILIDNVLIGGT